MFTLIYCHLKRLSLLCFRLNMKSAIIFITGYLSSIADKYAGELSLEIGPAPTDEMCSKSSVAAAFPLILCSRFDPIWLFSEQIETECREFRFTT